ncbi:MAG: serine/threonine protein kinase [Myxococcales bacterium]|nr:serine/threonine protein kinase [Myxococcales bacterium]HQY60252.1 serine/threonine-protein kinase [Polyangiaceae bacterium]
MSQPNRRPEETGQIKPLEAFDLSLAASLGKYRLLGALGHGGMADVYLAIADGPEGFRKLCVLKMLKESMEQDEDFRAMFLDEARLAARMNHPNVVQTFEVDDTQGRLMLAMEYVEGQPITRVRRRVAPEQFPLTAYVRVLCDVLEGLDYAHNLADYDGTVLGIVHRDVTPHNILVGYDGRVKLVDFGIAKSAAASQMTQAGVLKGKVGYMSPEQASLGAVDGRADVFSVGVILWEAIAGRRFAEGASARDVLTRRIDGSDPKIAEIVPEVDPELAAICDRAMATKPANRFPTPSEFQIALEGWLRKHGEPPRKTWAKALRDAFAPEREQLRALIEQRVTDNGMSGIRSSLFTTGSHAVSSSGPHSVPRISTEPAEPAPTSGESRTFAQPPVVVPSDATSRISLPEPRPGRSLPVVVAVAAAVAVGFGVAAYVVHAQGRAGGPQAATQPPAPPPPSAAPATVPATPASALTAAPTPTPSASVAAQAAPATPHGHVFVPGAGVPRVGAPAPTVAHSGPAATTVAAPTPTTKPSARALDEKDPYAP